MSILFSVAMAAAAAGPAQFENVVVPLVAEPLPAEAMAERTVRAGEPFLQQRLTAVRSATLQTDVATDVQGGRRPYLPKGTRLILATSVRSEYWCGSYTPATLERIGGVYKIQWLCLQDTDGDQAFDRAWLTGDNAGAFLPSFSTVHLPRSIPAAAYTIDPEDGRYAYETAIVHEKSFNIYNSLFFYQKARRPGEEAWRNVASITQGVQGGYTTVPGGKLPQTASLNGFRFEVKAKAGQGVTIQPVAAPKGVVRYGMSISPRF